MLAGACPHTKQISCVFRFHFSSTSADDDGALQDEYGEGMIVAKLIQ